MQEIEGIIVGEQAYSETSKIVRILTKEYGIVSCLAKGARSLKSDLRSVSTKMTYGIFHMYYKEGKLSTLISVDMINSFKQIKKEISKISYASFLLDLTEQVMKQYQDEEIYTILISALKKIEEGFDALVITNIVELKMLSFLGVMPVIDSCSVCGGKTSIATLSSDKGGYICNNCLTDEKIVDERTVKLIRMFYYVDIEKISNLEISEVVKKEMNLFLDNYYDRYTGLYLKSKAFLKNLMKTEML